jgi:5'-3' exonuclease
VVAWDSRSKRKRDLYPNYKLNRDKPKDIAYQMIIESAINQLIYIKRVLNLMGIDQYKCKGYELMK